ncbi:MAG: hypothetical protein Q9M09_01010 [Mariprofundaceae bacterium]|nr:hypothetical protein [Mariprofundaceae bacterium]
MTSRYFFILLTTLMVSGTMTAYADLYQCETGRGTINYTNKPCMDQAPPEPQRLAANTEQGNRSLLDPSQLMAQEQRPATVVVAPSPVATEQKQPLVAKVTAANKATPESQAVQDQDASHFSATHYREGMQWLLQHHGSLAHYERYEITHIENDVISCRRTLLNSKKQPFAGGISEDFSLDLRQQVEPSEPAKPLSIAGYVFDTQQHQGEQSTIWHVSQLPIITPLIRYRNGDESVLIEFIP